MRANQPSQQANKNLTIVPPARARQVQPDTSKNLATRRFRPDYGDGDESQNEEESRSSSLSSSVEQPEQASQDPSASSHPIQSSSELSPSAEVQIPMNADPKPTTIQQQSFAAREIFELIIRHMVNSIPISNRASRLDYLLLQLKEGEPLKDVMNKFDKKDLAIIAQHKKFIEILANNFTSLLEKEEYAKLKPFNHQQIILNVYASFSLDVSINHLRAALAKEHCFSKRQSAKLGTAFIDELMERIRKDFETNNIMFVSEEDQIMQRRIEGKEIERLLNVDPFSDFGLEKDSQFDQVSKYGIFCNKKEEAEMSKEGVFNYRLHRTMLAIQKFGIMVPQENLKLAKKLALFIIKLTDQHVTNIVEASMRIAEVASKSSAEAGTDEVAYFSAERQQGRFNHPQNIKEYEEIAVSKLKYPSLMKMYRDLRTVELIEEQRLHDNLYLEMMDKFSHGKKRLSKDQKIVVDYFTKKPSATDCIARLKADTEKEPMRHKNILNKIAIQPRHIKHYLQSHQLYRNHQILWRFNVIY